MANDWQFQTLTVKSLLLSRLQSAIDLSGGGRVYLTCLQPDQLLANPPLEVIENGAIYQIDRANRRESPLKLHEIPLNRAKDRLGVVYISAIALKLAKIWQQPPQTIVAQLVENLQALGSGDFAIKVAPSGMIQFELTDVALAVWLQRLAQTALPLPESRILSAVSVDRLFPIQYSHARCCSLLRMAHRDRLIAIVNPDPPATPQIWSLTAPNPIPWLDDKKLRLVHPAEYNLISQLLAVLDTLYPITEVDKRQNPVNYLKLANSLSEAFQSFYSQCRIWGEVKIETPKLAQARLGLTLATQSLLRLILEELLNAVAPLEL
jgi:arginyl-tRNA synthetase